MCGVSCTKPEPSLSKVEKKRIDSLFLENKPLIEDTVDSLCAKNRKGWYDSAVDSIKSIRLKEIENLLGQ